MSARKRPAPVSAERTTVRCAIYVRKSTGEGLDAAFSSLDAQEEACRAYVASQALQGWVALPDVYSDGGYSGATIDRPGLQRLLDDIDAGTIGCVVVQRVDRLSRSLLDFSNMMSRFEARGVAFCSVTQSFDTSTSMGRLTLRLLLSFAEFERELICERTRDKMSAARRKGRWVGGCLILGYDVAPGGGRIVVNPSEAKDVVKVFEAYAEHQSLAETIRVLKSRGIGTKRWTTRKGTPTGGAPWTKSRLALFLSNVIFIGKVNHKGTVYDGQHDAIVPLDLWERVQGILRRNARTGGRETRNKHGALLRGLLYCATCGSSMHHTYAQKPNRARYRYYIHKPGSACSIKPLPAREVEAFVAGRIQSIGSDPALQKAVLDRARTESPDIDPDALEGALQRFTPVWDALSPREQARALQLLVSRVEYDGDRQVLSITFRSSGIAALTEVETA